MLGKDDCSAFKKIHPKHPYIEAEIKYAIKEYAVTAVDFIARRIRLAFLNYKAANEILPTVVKVMGKELKWTEGKLVSVFYHNIILLAAQSCMLYFTPKNKFLFQTSKSVRSKEQKCFYVVR